MTTTTDPAAPSKDPGRPRPELHFTVSSGWTNDPHGIVHADGRYHMFFQYNPAGIVWSEACHWGHAVSDDLITWSEHDVALTPTGNEVGCWSGATVFDNGVPTIVYTRITGENWGRGQIALARGDRQMDHWRREPTAPVVDGPPPSIATLAFRDPYVWAVPDGWRMIVGAGTTDGRGAALQYSSPDLLEWTYDGILASRHTSDTDPIWTGKLWECPQLFELDGTWVLLASIWDDDVLHHSFYALGDYDGTTFVPGTWGRFTHGKEAYATTTFLDADGRRCAMAWLRESQNTAPEGSPFAGAMSLPLLLSVESGLLIARQHPNLRALATQADEIQVRQGSCERHLSVGGPTLLSLQYAATEGVTITFRNAEDLLRINAHYGQRNLSVTAGGASVLEVPLDGDRLKGGLVLLVDGDIMELSIEGVEGVAMCRIPNLDGADVLVKTAVEADLRIWRFTGTSETAMPRRP